MPLIFEALRKPGDLFNRQGIHIGPQTDYTITGLASPDYAHHTSPADTGYHFIAAESVQLFGNMTRRFMHLIHQFRIGMILSAPCRDFVMKLRHAVDNCHDALYKMPLEAMISIDYRLPEPDCLVRQTVRQVARFVLLQEHIAVFVMRNHFCDAKQPQETASMQRLAVSGLPFFFAVIIAALCLPALPVRAEQPLPDTPYVLVDAADNTVIAANRLDERWHPASLTKLMTAYVVFRAIKSGEISAGSPVTVTATAAKTPPGKMGYRQGTTLRFDMALYTLIVKSANDVAVAVAESLAGNVPAFVARMNDEANRLGFSNTRFVNPHGLHDTGQYVSARDMVILASAIWNEFPQYRAMFETPDHPGRGETLHVLQLSAGTL